LKKFSFWFLLLTTYNISLLIPKSYSQDLISLKTGEEVKANIISISKGYISLHRLDDDERELHEIKRKSIKWYRPESWTNDRLSLSFSFGAIPISSSNDLKKFMEDNNYSHPRSSFFGGSNTEYPISYVPISWMVELEYLFTSPHGISLSFSRINNGSVSGYGYNDIEYISPEVYYKNAQLSISYKYFFKSYRTSIQAGALLNFNTTSWEIRNGIGQFISNNSYPQKVQPGLLFGFSGSIIERRIFFLRLQSLLLLIPPVKISSNDELLPDEKISQICLYLGLQTGFKFYVGKEKNDETF
jgi:hypothetical protein